MGRKVLAAVILSLVALVAAGQYRYPVSINEMLSNTMSETPELKKMDEKIDSFMTFWGIRGASLSIMRGDSLLFSKGYGWADKERGRRMEPGTTMRLASVSKLLTAVGIMTLQEKGLLNIQSPVFGPYGILSEYDRYIRDDNYYLITVEHLLRHQGGFTRRFGDPMFSTQQLMRQHGLTSPPDAETILRTQLPHRLDFEPGTSTYYSNLGYLLLSLIIEKTSGKSYEQFMQEEVFEKAGCYDFHIAGNYYKDRYNGESRYYMQADSEPVSDISGSGNLVEKCYGGNDLPTLSGAGAWVGSTPELARLVASIDGILRVPDILGFFSIYQMTQRLGDEIYPLGWIDATSEGELTRTGSFSGTSALIKYYPDGECWIMVTNTSTWRGSRFTKNTSGFFNKLRPRFSDKLPKQDLFIKR